MLALWIVIPLSNSLHVSARCVDIPHQIPQMKPNAFVTYGSTTFYTYRTNGLFEQAHALWLAGKPAQAIQYLDKALAIDPNNSIFLNDKKIAQSHLPVPFSEGSLNALNH